MKEFEDIVGKDFLSTDHQTCSRYAVDGMEPQAVLFPGDVEALSGIVRTACQEHLSVVPWGGGTQMAKGAIPSRLDLVICTERLDRIIDIDAGNLTATVQAGVRLYDLQRIAAGNENRCYIPVAAGGKELDESVCSLRENRGCFVPLDVFGGSRTTIGGIIAANTSGPRRLLYGLPRDIVLGVRYVASTGEIVGMGGKTVKNVAGYDLCKLMIGSMGTLGILSEMTLRLLPLPERSGTWIFIFPGLEEAAACVDAVFAAPLLPCAVEILNLKACDGLPADVPERGEQGYFGVVAGAEGSDEAVERMKTDMETLADAAGATEKMYLDDDAHREFWSSYGPPAAGFFGEQSTAACLKLNYPLSCYRRVLELAESDEIRDHVSLASYTHAGSGVTRIYLAAEESNKSRLARTVEWTERLLTHVSEIGGNLVVEHAGPELKKHLPVWGALRDDVKVMHWVKRALDPEGILSPGRFVGGA
jgi:FAD/FMN-containing dehydrogenase